MQLDDGALRPMSTRVYPDAGLTAVTSSSHLDDSTKAFLATRRIASQTGIGSSLKFCLVAKGAADIYPRFGPTMEWDTAAGQAVLMAAGGCVTTPEGAPFTYGHHGRGYLNGPFIAWGREPA
jgi:3'(2'), 5'-bisphosphate nucleotidase